MVITGFFQQAGTRSVLCHNAQRILRAFRQGGGNLYLYEFRIVAAQASGGLCNGAGSVDKENAYSFRITGYANFISFDIDRVAAGEAATGPK